MRYWKVENDGTVDRIYGDYVKPYPEGIIDEADVSSDFYNVDPLGLFEGR